MISKKEYNGDGVSKRFLSDFIIRSEQFARPYVYIYDNTLPSDGTGDVLQDGTTDQANWSYPDNIWKRGGTAPKSSDLVTVDKWQVVDNSILFFEPPSSLSTVWIEVATTASEFGDTLVAPSAAVAQAAADLAVASRDAAAVSETNAATSETNAATSETNALASANAAATSETNAATSETNASNSATAAATSETNAATSELNASNSATAAATSEANASASELNAATSETNAATSEANALVSENNAKTSEINAANSAASVDANNIVHTEGSGLANELLTYLKTIDGVGSGLDADLLDGFDSQDYARSITTVSDADLATTTGMYDYNGWTNIPAGAGTIGSLIVSNAVSGTTAARQIYIDSYGKAYTRYGSGAPSVWNEWVSMWTSANDGAGSGLDADTVDGVQGALLGIGGAGYTWVDETANRVADTTYTNTTGRPIMVSFYHRPSAGTIAILTVDGLAVQSGSNATDAVANFSVIVPNNSTYSINKSPTAWLELK